MPPPAPEKRYIARSAGGVYYQSTLQIRNESTRQRRLARAALAKEVHAIKAIQITEHGGPEALKYQELPDLNPGDGEALLEIQAVGVNYTDVYNRAGATPGLPLPRIIGVEGAGVVRRVGQGVSQVK